MTVIKEEVNKFKDNNQKEFYYTGVLIEKIDEAWCCRYEEFMNSRKVQGRVVDGTSYMQFCLDCEVKPSITF